MIRTAVVVAALTLTLGAGAVIAQQQDPAAAREALMKENGKNQYGVLNGMVRGQKPYDQAAVDTALAQLETSSKQISALFPDTAKASAPGDEYTASAKIWENKADFEAHISKYIAELAVAKTKIKDLNSLKAEYPVLNDTCSSCHETYRIKNS